MEQQCDSSRLEKYENTRLNQTDADKMSDKLVFQQNQIVVALHFKQRIIS